MDDLGGFYTPIFGNIQIDKSESLPTLVSNSPRRVAESPWEGKLRAKQLEHFACELHGKNTKFKGAG